MNNLTVNGTPYKRKQPAQRARKEMTIRERIQMHTKVDENGCWIWQLACFPGGRGYGRITINGVSNLYVHRISYEEYVGPIPDGYQVDHLCRVRCCCNPEHLEPVTQQENILRGMAAGAVARRRERCEYGGHLMADHAVMWSGRRVCRTCRLAYGAIYRSMTRDEREQRRAAGLPIVDLATYFATDQSA